MRSFFTSLTVLMVLQLAACGDDKPELTWGEYSERYSEVYCEAAYACWGSAGGDYEEKDVDKCVRHSVYHFCELDGNCSDEIEDSYGANQSLDICEDALAAMDEYDCSALLFFGVLPEECYPVGDYFPESE